MFKTELEKKLHFVMYKGLVEDWIYSAMITIDEVNRNYESYIFIGYVNNANLSLLNKFLKPFRLVADFTLLNEIGIKNIPTVNKEIKYKRTKKRNNER